MLLKKPVRPNPKKLILCLLLTFVVFIFLDIHCIFRSVTGFPCPGCGMTRAHFAALSLDFRSAFHFHPLWFLPVPLILITIFFPNGLFVNPRINNLITILLIILLLGVYIIRMIRFFPDTPPMDFEVRSLFGWLAQKFHWIGTN